MTTAQKINSKDFPRMQTHMAQVCKWPECMCIVPDYAFSAHNRVSYCEEVKKRMDAPQANCVYGFVLPDACRYNNRLGCDCGYYPGTLPRDEV